MSRSLARSLAAGICIVPVVIGCGGEAPTSSVPATTGALVVTVSGLPAGVSAAAVVEGGGRQVTVTSSTVLEDLPPGAYAVRASNVVASDQRSFAPESATQSVTVEAGKSVSVTVGYVATTGGLQISFSGLPPGTQGAAVVTGPGGETRAVTGPGTLLGLAPGSYEVRADSVTSDAGKFAPTQRSRTVVVEAGAPVTVVVAYTLFAPANPDVSRLVDSIRVVFGLPALGGAIVTRANHRFALGVAGTRRASGGAAATAQDLWHLGSNFKAFTGMLAAVAVGRDSISWSTTVGSAFPELAGSIRPEYQHVTLQELLAHLSGLPRDPTTAVGGDSRREQRESVAGWALMQPPVSARGTFHYTNTGYMIAAAMIERALGVAFEEAMTGAVFAPLGITAGFGPQAAAGSTLQPVAHVYQNGGWVALENHDNPPVYSSAGGAHMSMESWARFLQEVLRLEAHAPTLVPLAAGLPTTSSIATIDAGHGYGMGWLITDRTWANGRTLTHDGTNVGNYSVTWLAPLRGFAVLVVTNSFDPTSAARSAMAADALAGRLIQFYLTGR